eukprot:TRINITY_DN2640_c1_g2_i1.p1 TRINITY_DN2640_c1_g2~~TRINITY_DN2640_c1_g2_i1.p1  ORF type:complete len:1285 (-),score=154.69 TRINITY_DN2640_c1_g2_i1:20-3385(-)
MNYNGLLHPMGSIIHFSNVIGTPSLISASNVQLYFNWPGGLFEMMQITNSTLFFQNDTSITCKTLSTGDPASSSIVIDNASFVITDQSPVNSILLQNFNIIGNNFNNFEFNGTLFADHLSIISKDLSINGPAIIANDFNYICGHSSCSYVFGRSASLTVTTGIVFHGGGGSSSLVLSSSSTIVAPSLSVIGKTSATQSLYIMGGTLNISQINFDIPFPYINLVAFQTELIVLQPNTSLTFLQSVTTGGIRSIQISHKTSFVIFGPCRELCAVHNNNALLPIFSNLTNIGVSSTSLSLQTHADVEANYLYLSNATVECLGSLIVRNELYVFGDGTTIIAPNLLIDATLGVEGPGILVVQAPVIFSPNSLIIVKDASIMWNGIVNNAYPSIFGNVGMTNSKFIFNSFGAYPVTFSNVNMAYSGDNSITGSNITFLNGGGQWFDNSSLVVDGHLTLSPNYLTTIVNATNSRVYLILLTSISWLSQLDIFRPSPYMVVSGPARYYTHVYSTGLISVQPYGTSLLQPNFESPSTMIVEGAFVQFMNGILLISITPNGCDSVNAMMGRSMGGTIKFNRIPLNSVDNCAVVRGPNVNHTLPENWDFSVEDDDVIAQSSTITLTGNEQGILYNRGPIGAPICPLSLPYTCDVSGQPSSFNLTYRTPTLKVRITNKATKLWTFDSNTYVTQLSRTPLSCFPNASLCASASSKPALVCPPSLPFLCNSFVIATEPTCVSSPVLCSVGFDAYKYCWDGSDRIRCPILPRCPSEYPQRCSDGSCVTSSSLCIPPSSCSFQDKTRCVDGICRPSCPSYDGCGLVRPFHCPDGRCAKTWDRCTTVNETLPTCPSGQCACPNNPVGQCRPTCAQCTDPLVTIKPVPMKVLVNLNETVTVTVAAGGGNNYICNVSIPYGAIITLSGHEAFVYIDYVPDSALYTFLPPINYTTSSASSNSDDDDDDDDYDLSYIRSAVVNITASLEAVESSTISVTNFNLPVGINLKIDPAEVSRLKELCLAYVDERTNRWVCVDTNLALVMSTGDDVIVSGYTTHFTSYAILVNYRSQQQTNNDRDDDIQPAPSQTSAGGVSLEVMIAVPIASVVFAAGAVGLWLLLARKRRSRESEREIKAEDLSL